MAARPLSATPLLPPALLALVMGTVRCGGSPGVPDPAGAAGRLSAYFPGQSATVLGAGSGFERTATGFTARGAGRLTAELPADAAGPMVLRAGRSRVSIREIGASGEVQAVDHALAYRRAGGFSFWTALPDGMEEWIRFDAGAVRDGLPAATWEIEGATLIPRDGAVEVAGRDGVHLWVTAPAAFAEGGAPVRARLAARGATLELYVEAGGRGVLVDPKWVKVAPLPGPLEFHAAVALADGRVMVAGGDDGNTNALPVAAIYDPKPDMWTKAKPMATPHADHTATLLTTGEVVVVGGVDQFFNGNGVTEIYDPAADAWTQSKMPNQHASHTATLLQSGAVLVAGGFVPNSGFLMASDNVDLYDPTLGVGGGWGPTTHLTTPRYNHAACLLADGTVLVTGGNDGGGSLDTSEIYDPVDQSWTATPTSMVDARESHACATLADGTVLVAGGAYSGEGFGALSSAEIYDPVAQTWSSVGPMASAHYLGQMAPIGGGQWLMVGGYDGNVDVSSTEIYDPLSKTWSAGPSLLTPREDHSLTAIGNTLVAAGGYDGNNVTASTELIVFGLPNGAPCTSAPPCGSGFCTEGVCCDQDCKGTCTSCTAALKGSGTDGTCGPVAAGTNPGDVCPYQGPSTCGTTGYCDGKGACGTYPDGTVCLESTPCIVAVCSHGVCGGPFKLDGSPCPGGVCIAGACIPDPGATTSGSSSSGGTTGTISSSSGSTGSGTTTSGAGGEGGADSTHGAQLSGSGCQVTPGPRGAEGGVGALLLGLLAARRSGGHRRRRR